MQEAEGSMQLTCGERTIAMLLSGHADVPAMTGNENTVGIVEL